MDAPQDDALASSVEAAFARDGVRVRVAPQNAYGRTYVLLEGPQGVDPLDLQNRLRGAHWYDEAIIALAIEPQPEDALPHLVRALAGDGAPLGVCNCERAGGAVLVELRPSVTPASLVLRVVDVELERFHGYRRTQLLAPLPAQTVAQIAAQGVQAPEIAPDRVLETLLEAARVE